MIGELQQGWQGPTWWVAMHAGDALGSNGCFSLQCLRCVRPRDYSAVVVRVSTGMIKADLAVGGDDGDILPSGCVSVLSWGDSIGTFPGRGDLPRGIWCRLSGDQRFPAAMAAWTWQYPWPQRRRKRISGERRRHLPKRPEPFCGRCLWVSRQWLAIQRGTAGPIWRLPTNV